MKADGYRLSHLETYRHGGVRYAGIWEERGSPAQQLYIGMTATEHQAEVDRLTALGYRPRAVSVVDDGGLKYSALWEQVSGGGILRSTLTLPEYRTWRASSARTAGRSRPSTPTRPTTGRISRRSGIPPTARSGSDRARKGGVH